MQNVYRISITEKHILIVDDNPQNLQVLGKLLKEMNYNIEFATNGKAALEWLENKRFDILLLDINMPEMNGFEVCKIIRSNPAHNHLSIIFLTADTDRESILKGFDYGAQDYITKPFDSRELLARIHTHLSLKQSIDSLEELNQTLEQKVIERTRELTTSKEKAEEGERLKTAFLQNLSHEIRTPMNGILGFAQLLRDRVINPDTFIDYVDIIIKSGERMMSIINDLVEISKIEAGQITIQPHEFNINMVLETLVLSFSDQAKEKGLKLILGNKANTDDVMYSDREVMVQVMSNLIKNALKFTNEGMVSIGYEKTNGLHRFSVKDTGIGIEPGKQELIFERFIQGDSSISRGYEGAGLGLSIAKAYVEALKGTIGLESEVGKGSVFTITIPETETVTNGNAFNEIAPTTYPIQEGLSILIVEDNTASRNLLIEYFAEINADIQVASNGKEALEKVMNQSAFDLILMDLKMPVMNGYEATQLIRRMGYTNPIIAQTAYASKEDIELADKSGFSDLIAKPIDQNVLMGMIGKVMTNNKGTSV